MFPFINVDDQTGCLGRQLQGQWVKNILFYRFKLMLRKMSGLFHQLVRYHGWVLEPRLLPSSCVLLRSPSVSARGQKRREVLRSDKDAGWRGQNTVSFLSLACEPTHRQGFLSLKRISASTGLSSRLGQRQRQGRAQRWRCWGWWEGRASQGTRLLWVWIGCFHSFISF